MLKKDINKYNTAQPSGRPMGRTDGETARAAGGTAHAVLTMFGKLLKTVLCICIITGCLVGFERKFAVRFSFILSIPAVLGANILSIKDALDAGVNWGELPVYLVGVLVAAVSGYACIRLLKMIANRGRFGWFAYYCWAVGLLTLILKFTR